MALRATRWWHVRKHQQQRQQQVFFSSSISPKTKVSTAAAVAANAVHGDQTNNKPRRGFELKADLTPVYMIWGFVAVAVGLGIHTAKQNLFHGPMVQVTKKKRETVPEVEDPDVVVSSADKFLNKSFLRKVAHIQDQSHLPLPSTGPLPCGQDVESLKSAGVLPRGGEAAPGGGH